MATVAGVGTGIFVFFFFLALCIVICLLGSRTKAAWFWYWLSTIIFGVVFAVIFASPKGNPVPPPEGFDQTIVPLIVIMSTMCVWIIFGGLCMLIYVVCPTKYARPLRYDIDVAPLMEY